MIKTLSEAHANTNTKLEDLQVMFRKPQVGWVLSSDISEGKVASHWGGRLFSLGKRQLMLLSRVQDMNQLLYYKNLCKEELWKDCANKLTDIIQNIIEFAKLIPGFMRLGQDDQVGHCSELTVNKLFKFEL